MEHCEEFPHLKEELTINEVISQYPEQALKVMQNMQKTNDNLKSALQSIKSCSIKDGSTKCVHRLKQLASGTFEDYVVGFDYGTGTEKNK